MVSSVDDVAPVVFLDLDLVDLDVLRVVEVKGFVVLLQLLLQQVVSSVVLLV